MESSNRRQLLAMAGGALTVAVAGCSGGTDAESTDNGDGGGTPTPTEEATLSVPEGDASFTFSLGGGAPDFETLIVDFDRIVFRGESDDATLTLADNGLDMTALPEGGKTYFEEEPFPSGNYTAADCYLTVQEATLSDGGEATFSGDSPVTVDLVLFDEPLEVSSGQTTTLNITLTATPGFDEEEFSFSTGWSSY